MHMLGWILRRFLFKYTYIIWAGFGPVWQFRVHEFHEFFLLSEGFASYIESEIAIVYTWEIDITLFPFPNNYDNFNLPQYMGN